MSGFNPWNEVRQFMKEVRQFMEEMRQFKAEQHQFNQEQRQFQTQVTVWMTSADVKLETIIAEVSRYKGESGELMLSAFAFCTIHGVTFTHGDLFTYGGKATRYSRKHGFRIESVQDPRFGAVNLYEAEVLERVILGFTDDDYKV